MESKDDIEELQDVKSLLHIFMRFKNFFLNVDN